MKEELKAAYDAAHVKTEWMTIKSVQLQRGTQTLFIAVDRIANVVSAETVSRWETELRALMPAYSIEFRYTDVEPEPVRVTAAPKKKNEVEVDLPANGALFGKPIPSGTERVLICELNSESNKLQEITADDTLVHRDKDMSVFAREMLDEDVDGGDFADDEDFDDEIEELEDYEIEDIDD